jgi:hypothetical protein
MPHLILPGCSRHGFYLKCCNFNFIFVHRKSPVPFIQGSGCFFLAKMPGCCLPSLIAATALQFTTGGLQLSLEQEPTLCFAFLGGNSTLLIRTIGAIILA